MVVISLFSGLCFEEYSKEKGPILLKNMLLQCAIEVSMITVMETGHNKDRKQYKKSHWGIWRTKVLYGTKPGQQRGILGKVLTDIGFGKHNSNG